MIINLTQHPATPEQIAAGVVDLVGADHDALVRLLTFDELPENTLVWRRADEIALLVGDEYTRAMIGGAPFLMEPLMSWLLYRGVRPLFAFSKRVSEEQVQPDGSVRKVAVFRHEGFVG